MKAWFKCLSVILPLLAFNGPAISQLSIDGPTCAIAGQVYQYNIVGDIQDTLDLTVCITGGTVIQEPNKCFTKRSNSFFRVVWDSSESAVISLKSKSNVYDKKVTVTEPLTPGALLNADGTIFLDATIFQDTAVAPGLIRCSLPTGGSCDPLYLFQWESSMDHLRWEEVPNATSPDLTISVLLKNTAYYRRKLIETSSNTTAFSNILTIVIIK